MLIAKIENDTITVGEYQTLFPNTSFPPSGPSDDFLSENGCKKVNLFKDYDHKTQKLSPCDPYEEGEWVYMVQVESKTQEEMDADRASLAANIRAERARLLAKCDWTQLADSPADKQAWAIYRQELRDIPDQAGFPDNVVWPKDPDWVAI